MVLTPRPPHVTEQVPFDKLYTWRDCPRFYLKKEFHQVENKLLEKKSCLIFNSFKAACNAAGQGSADFFCKRSDSQHSRLCWSSSLWPLLNCYNLKAARDNMETVFQ